MNKFINAVIIEDEEDGRVVLRSMLQSYCPQVRILQECASSAEGVEAIRNQQPDLVFLDIRMPMGNGFTLLDKVKDQLFQLIFVTAHHDYALQAIRYAALDYLLKPIDPEELKEAVGRCNIQPPSHTRERITHFVENYQCEEITKVILPVRDGYVFVKVDDIIRCEADSNYTRLYLSGGEKQLISKTLKEIEAQLPSRKFFRIHKSHIINVAYLKKYTKGDGGTVTLSDSTELDVSRRNREEFLKLFNL
jgi:two-component system LytT family response regulator